MTGTNTHETQIDEDTVLKKEIAAIRKQGIEKRLKGTSKAFNLQAKSLKKDILRLVKKKPNAIDLTWKGAITRFGFTICEVDFKDSNHEDIKAFKNLQDTCEKLGVTLNKINPHTGDQIQNIANITNKNDIAYRFTFK